MKAYKGFNKDMTCRGFQYEVGKEYETDKAKLCECGFHACLYPLGCFSYYPPENSRYCLVEISDVVESKENNDTKICGKKIKIIKELSISEMTTASVEYVLDKVDENNKNSGNMSSAVNYGYMSSAVNSGYMSSAVNYGDMSSAVNTGNRSSAVNSGYMSSAVNSGNRSSAVNYGDMSSAVNTGDMSSAVNTGNRSSAVNSGYMSSAVNSGKDSVSLAAGYKCKAKACLGSAICVVERGNWNGKTYPLIAIKAAIVDGKKIKADTWYKLESGEFVEVNEE